MTLEACAGPQAQVWGKAFKIADERVPEVLADLRYREKQYDIEAVLDLYDADDRVVVRGATTWIASPNVEANPNYLGPAPLDAIAEQIADASGPSGPNAAYLLNLVARFQALGVPIEDETVDLARRVEALIAARDDA